MDAREQQIPLIKHPNRYLIDISSQDLLYQQSNEDILASYADAEVYAAPDRRSTTGHLQISYGAPLAWCSKKQVTIQLSTCEAEYLVATQALQEILSLP